MLLEWIYTWNDKEDGGETLASSTAGPLRIASILVAFILVHFGNLEESE